MHFSYERIPVVLLTGFLGSGKTTLLNRVLGAGVGGTTTLVLLNEYGEVGIDHHLVADLPGEHVLLSAGCVCCTMRSDLLTALDDAYRARQRGTLPPFERVVVETTGVANPIPLVAALGPTSPLSASYRLARIITCADVGHLEAQLATGPEPALQVAVADAVVLTKLPAEGAPDAVVDAITGLQPTALLLGADAPDDLLEALFRGDGEVEASFDELEARLDGTGRPPAAAHPYRAYAFELPSRVDVTAFRAWLRAFVTCAGEPFLRLKAIVHPADETQGWVFHGVRHVLYPPTRLPARARAPGVLVLIGQELSEAYVDALRAALRGFAAPEPSPRRRRGSRSLEDAVEKRT
ncbi:MAG: GTP-binding protein [Myxococcota bacterium]